MTSCHITLKSKFKVQRKLIHSKLEIMLPGLNTKKWEKLLINISNTLLYMKNKKGHELNTARVEEGINRKHKDIQ